MEWNQFGILVFNDERDIHASRKDIAIWLMRNFQVAKQSSEKCGEDRWGEKGEVRLVSESVGDGTEHPSIIAAESLIQKELAQDFEEPLREREG